MKQTFTVAFVLSLVIRSTFCIASDGDEMSMVFGDRRFDSATSRYHDNLNGKQKLRKIENAAGLVGAISQLANDATSEYRTITRSKNDVDDRTVGAQGQELAMLAGFIVIRYNKADGAAEYFTTDRFQRLPAHNGNALLPAGLKPGDRILAFHTGNITTTDGKTAIPTNMDLKGLRNAAIKTGKDTYLFPEATIVFDAASGKIAGINRNGNLFLIEDGQAIDMSNAQRDLCDEPIGPYGRTFDTDTIDAISGNDNSSPACPLFRESPDTFSSVKASLRSIQKNGYMHYCTSFRHIKTIESKDATTAAEHGNWQVYQCTECGDQTGFYDKDNSIENIIAQNKAKQKMLKTNSEIVSDALNNLPSAAPAAIQGTNNR